MDTIRKLKRIIEQTQTGTITECGIIRDGDVIYRGFKDDSIKELVWLHREIFLLEFTNGLDILFDDLRECKIEKSVNRYYHLKYNDKTVATIIVPKTE